jgi:hypothetical protein
MNIELKMQVANNKCLLWAKNKNDHNSYDFVRFECKVDPGVIMPGLYLGLTSFLEKGESNNIFRQTISNFGKLRLKKIILTLKLRPQSFVKLRFCKNLWGISQFDIFLSSR